MLLDLDLGSAGHQQERASPTSAIVTALRSAYMAEGGWADADWSTVIALAHLEGAGLTLGAGGRVLLQVPPVPRPSKAVSFPVEVNGRRVGTAIVARSASGLLPAEVGLRTKLAEGIALSALLAAALAVSFALLASRWLVAPLHRLTVAVTRYGEGDRSTRAGVNDRSDEIGELGQAFDTMAAELERQDYLRKALVADVAHELRTPLAVLRAQIDAVSLGIADFSMETLRSLSEETDRLTRFVDDLAVLAAADATGLRLERHRVDLAQVAGAAAARLASRFAERSVLLDLDLEQAPVLADPGRLEQVVVNLLTNAEKFSPEGAVVRLRVSHQRTCAVLVVSDNGPGIQEAEQQRIFDRFYRGASASGGRRAPGSGVGLAVVSEIVAAHGGTIDVESAPSKGSTFTLRLPNAA